MIAALRCSGEIMIGPPGLPKLGRRVFSFAGSPPAHASLSLHPLKRAAGLYVAGVLAHFSHHMALGLPAGMSLDDALISAPISLVWPADLIGTLMALT
jgi:hypothetical protein